MFRPAAAFIVFVSAVLAAGSVLAQQRLPTIPPDQYTADQKRAAEEFLAARKVPVFGPFEPMMHSPEVMNMARAMGDYLRYHSAIGNTLSELVVLVTARVVARLRVVCALSDRTQGWSCQGHCGRNRRWSPAHWNEHRPRDRL